MSGDCVSDRYRQKKVPPLIGHRGDSRCSGYFLKDNPQIGKRTPKVECLLPSVFVVRERAQ